MDERNQGAESAEVEGHSRNYAIDPDPAESDDVAGHGRMGALDPESTGEQDGSQRR